MLADCTEDVAFILPGDSVVGAVSADGGDMPDVSCSKVVAADVYVSG